MTGLYRRLNASPKATLAVIIFTITALRVLVLLLTPLNLGPDEAQYWSWSLRPDFGYFSKPPLIAWLIGASTSVCGTTEACVRITSPFLHAMAATFIYFAARALYEERTAFWSAITYLLIPGTSFSSLLITTDVPLICFWTLALWAVAELRAEYSWRWAALLGAAIGLGLLSKYAMLYFVLGIALALLPTRDGISSLLDRRMWVSVAVAAAVFSPNVIWNLTHGFATLRHTASNANWGADRLFNVAHIFEFLGAQAGIMGPVAAGILVFGLWRAWKARSLAGPDLMMLTLSLPIIAIVTVQAFISRANANWAAPAFVTLCIIVCAWAVRQNQFKVLLANTVVNASIAVLLAAMATSPAFVSAIGQENSVKRLRGWDECAGTSHLRHPRHPSCSSPWSP